MPSVTAEDRKLVAADLSTSLQGTRLIFVFGRTGTGKTTLLRELTGMDLKVGESLSSGMCACQPPTLA
jgi:ABC-type cobalamin/Fe3+-siderophores transport system ATPase subunit